MKGIENLIQHLPKEDPRLFEALRLLNDNTFALNKIVTTLQSNKVPVMTGSLLANPVPTTSNPTTNSAVLAVVPEMSAQVKTSGTVLLLFSCDVRETNVNDVTKFQFFRDGVAIGIIMYVASPIAGQNIGLSMSFADNPRDGVHVYDVRWANSALGNVSTADLLNRSFLIIQLQ